MTSPFGELANIRALRGPQVRFLPKAFIPFGRKSSDIWDKMSTRYILEKLGEIDCLTDRKREASRLFRNFCEYIPTGQINPDGIDLARRLDDKKIREELSWASEFYTRLKEFCGGQLPEEIQGIYETFEKSRARTEELLGLSWETRRALPTHEVFPYWNRFNEVIHQEMENGWKSIDLEKITFLPEIIGRGGFSTIYRAQSEENKMYALKLFHSLNHFVDPFNGRRRAYEQIAKNLKTQKELFSKEPFASLVALSQGYDGILKSYLMNYVSGVTVKETVENKVIIPKETLGRVLITYSQMLEFLHNQDKLFCDNNWGAIIVNDKEVKICDYDFLADKKDVALDTFYPVTLRYSSFENLLCKGLTISSDLESFALMIDNLFVGRAFLGEKHEEERRTKAAAEINKREYPKERISKIPKNIGKLVSALITYPRDNSITASDFLSAIKQDYKI
jgi:hypothetical protein